MNDSEKPPTLRARAFLLLHPRRTCKQRYRVVDYFLQGLIFLNFMAFVWGTLPAIGQYHRQLELLRHCSMAVFAVEYLIRWWCVVEHKSFTDSLGGRISWMGSPLAIIDLSVLIAYCVGLSGVDLRFLRVVRLFRLIKYIQSRRYWEGVLLLRRTYLHARDTLTSAFLVFVVFIHAFAIMMYYAEHHLQPEAFASIPQAMWWAVITLTTVGYGDVTPVTNIGRCIATVTACTGIAMIGIPAGVIAAGLVEEWEKLKELRHVNPAKYRKMAYWD